MNLQRPTKHTRTHAHPLIAESQTDQMIACRRQPTDLLFPHLKQNLPSKNVFHEKGLTALSAIVIRSTPTFLSRKFVTTGGSVAETEML